MAVTERGEEEEEESLINWKRAKSRLNNKQDLLKLKRFFRNGFKFCSGHCFCSILSVTATSAFLWFHLQIGQEINTAWLPWR